MPVCSSFQGGELKRAIAPQRCWPARVVLPHSKRSKSSAYHCQKKFAWVTGLQLLEKFSRKWEFTFCFPVRKSLTHHPRLSINEWLNAGRICKTGKSALPSYSHPNGYIVI